MEYYLLSLRHTLSGNFCLNWHRLGGAYTYSIEDAHIFGEGSLNDCHKTGYNGDLAIPVDKVSAVVEDYYFNGDGWKLIQLVQNNWENRKALGLDLKDFQTKGKSDQKRWFSKNNPKEWTVERMTKEELLDYIMVVVCSRIPNDLLIDELTKLVEGKNKNLPIEYNMIIDGVGREINLDK